jgi:polyisoprenyl-phosphate glycosyltransferase
MDKIKDKISVIAPVYNEAEVVDAFSERVVKTLDATCDFFEIIFIDDGSTDKTFEKLNNLSSCDSRIKVVSFSRNFGHPMAISAGLDYATGDAVIIMDADLQDPPEIVADFLNKWKEGFDIVYGVRKKRKEWIGKRFCYWLFYRLFRKLSSIDMPLDSGDFCLMDVKVVINIRSLPERNRFIRGLRVWTGFKQIGIPYERLARKHGKTKYSFGKLVKLALDGILSFSYIPIRLATIFGLIIAGAAFLAILAVLFFRIFYGVIGTPGFSSIVILILFIGGIQLIAIGILGEYIARIYEEVKNRPLYVISQKIGL